MEANAAVLLMSKHDSIFGPTLKAVFESLPYHQLIQQSIMPNFAHHRTGEEKAKTKRAQY